MIGTLLSSFSSFNFLLTSKDARLYYPNSVSKTNSSIYMLPKSLQSGPLACLNGHLHQRNTQLPEVSYFHLGKCLLLPRSFLYQGKLYFFIIFSRILFLKLGASKNKYNPCSQIFKESCHQITYFQSK